MTIQHIAESTRIKPVAVECKNRDGDNEGLESNIHVSLQVWIQNILNQLYNNYLISYKIYNVYEGAPIYFLAEHIRAMGALSKFAPALLSFVHSI